MEATAKLVLIDWQRGELPYYTLPEDDIEVKFEKMKIGDNETIDKIK
jgi:hypothetical protein